jgi:spore coat polysaccharide biosynthesis protein SpsF (cytidylyltransferase family)
MKIGKYPMLEIMLERLKKSKKIDKIIIATTRSKKDDLIVEFCKKKKIDYYRGDSYNVLKRYYDAATKFKLKNIIRLTADCALIDPKIIDEMVIKFFKKKCDYLSNTCPHPSTYPDGSDCEIFNYRTLKTTHENAFLPSHREHVTFYMWQGNKKKFKIERHDSKTFLFNYRYTIDYKEDFNLLKSIYKHYKNKIFKLTTNEIVKFIDNNPKLIRYQKKLSKTIGWHKSFVNDQKYLKKLNINS